MKLPDKNTPPGTPCWVRDRDEGVWLGHEFLREEKCEPFRWRMVNNIRWKQCRLDDPYAKPVPHVHRDLMVQYANDPSQKVWCQGSSGNWHVIDVPQWDSSAQYHIGEEPPKPEPRMITIEGHTFAVPSPVQTETYDFRLIKGPWIREQDVAAYMAVRDALMALAIARALEGM